MNNQERARFEPSTMDKELKVGTAQKKTAGMSNKSKGWGPSYALLHPLLPPKIEPLSHTVRVALMERYTRWALELADLLGASPEGLSEPYPLPVIKVVPNPSAPLEPLLRSKIKGLSKPKRWALMERYACWSLQLANFLRTAPTGLDCPYLRKKLEILSRLEGN